MRIIVHHLAPPGAPRHVVGATLGEAHVAPLLATLQADIPDPGEIVILDFEGIDFASASYLKASVLRTLDAAQRSSDEDGRFNIFPVVAHLSPEITEELDAVLHANGVPCVEALEWDDDRILAARLHGPLDPALSQTLDLLVGEKQASATKLFEQNVRKVKITVTGWNNRLAQLHRFRLARRTKSGRQWIFEPVAAEVTRG